MVAPSNKRFLLESDKAAPNGLATLDGTGKIPDAQVPGVKFAAADNVLHVSTSGNNSNDGRAPGAAKASIQNAIDALASSGKHGEVRVGAGVYTEAIVLKDGISVVGAGSNMTTIKAPIGSSAAGLVTIAAGAVTGLRFEGFRLEGSGNAGQHGFYAYAVPAPTGYPHGGLWYSRFKDLTVVGFSGRGLWLRGGGSSYLIPHQFLVFEMVRVFTTKTVNKEALVVSGQVGQIDWIQCEFDSDEGPAPYGVTMTVPNVYLCAELADNGTYLSAECPYALTFYTTTLQGGWKAVYADQLVNSVEFINPHLEGFKYGFHANAGADLVIRNGGFSNVGNGDGTGYWTNTTIGGSVTVTGLKGGGTKDKTFVSDGNIGSYTEVKAAGSKTSAGNETTNLTKQVSVAGDGTVAMQGNRTVICSTSATQVTKIQSNATPGESLFIEAFSGPLTFATGGGLRLGGKAAVTIPDGMVAQFVRLDILNNWALVGAIPRDVGAWATVSTFTNSWSSVGGVNSPVQYRLSLDGAHVELAGQLTGGAAATAAFTLPAGFRPTKVKTLGGYSVGNGGGRGITVGTDGVVTVLAGVTAPISLDGVTFPIDG